MTPLTALAGGFRIYDAFDSALTSGHTGLVSIGRLSIHSVSPHPTGSGEIRPRPSSTSGFRRLGLGLVAGQIGVVDWSWGPVTAG